MSLSPQPRLLCVALLLSGFSKVAETQTLAGGLDFTCALFEGATIKCWGGNTKGQLGQGHKDNIGDDPDEVTYYMEAVSLAGGVGVKGVYSSGRHSCALFVGGGVKCWGSNDKGQLGYGDIINRGDLPDQMGENLPFVDLQGTPASLSLGTDFSCAETQDGSVYCWGSNSKGQLGLGNTANIGDGADEMGANLVAVDLGASLTAQDILSGGQHTCVLLNTFDVKCWGLNADGQLGLEDKANRGDGADEMGDNLPTVSLGTSVKGRKIGLGIGFSCAALSTGALKCWGDNFGGELGQGDTLPRGGAANEMGDKLPTVQLGGQSVEFVDNGRYHSCVRLEDGTVKCWGENTYGQLGYGDTDGRGNTAASMGAGLPVVDLGSSTVRQLSRGGDYHTCVEQGDEATKCWGSNDKGQLGYGDTENRGSAADQMGESLPAVVFYTTTFTASSTTISVSTTLTRSTSTRTSTSRTVTTSTTNESSTSSTRTFSSTSTTTLGTRVTTNFQRSLRLYGGLAAVVVVAIAGIVIFRCKYSQQDVDEDDEAPGAPSTQMVPRARASS